MKGVQMTASYPEGIDCVWLASDREGNVGAFATGGSGPIPVGALTETQPAIVDIEERVHLLPRTSQAKLLVTVKRPDDFIAMAERGLYVYDWSDVHRTAREAIGAYELMAAPLRPITAREMADEFAATLAGANLNTVSFETERLLDVRTLLPCCEPE